MKLKPKNPEFDLVSELNEAIIIYEYNPDLAIKKVAYIRDYVIASNMNKELSYINELENDLK